MYRQCCVRGCTSTRKDAVLHRFPTNSERMNLWLRCLNDDDLNSSVAHNLFVCEKHFEKRFIGENSRLKMDAHPTLFSLDEISSGVPYSHDSLENLDPLLDHGYTRKRHLDHNYCQDAPSSSGLQLPSKQRKLLCPLQQKSENINREGSACNISLDKGDQRPSCSIVPASVDAAVNPEEERPSTPIIGIQRPTSACNISLDQGNQRPSYSIVPTSVDAAVNPEEEQPSTPIIGIQMPTSACNISLDKGDPRPSCSIVPTSVDAAVNPEEQRPSTPIIGKQRPTSDVTTEKPRTPVGKTMARKRLIDKFKSLTPVAKRIYKEYKTVKYQANFHIRAKRALKFSKDQSFQKLSKDINPYAKKFLAMQINLCKKKKQGRRFSLEEKLISLAIMKQSPKCYRFLSKIFILPSVSTLNKMVSHLNIEAGINKKLFDLIKKEVSSWKDKKKYCSIIFDEMALDMGLAYDAKKDKISGFVDTTDRKARFADHVLVIMVRGCVYKWQQPVAYYYCEGATSGPELKKIIKDVVEAVAETGLKPLVLGCDQGTAFQSAIRSLKEDTKRRQILNDETPDDTIDIGHEKMHVIFDPSHLIKGMRNNFLNKNIKFENKIAKWQDIVDVYKTDCKHTESRLLHKLNDEHVIPAKIKKMKVKNCVRVLSKTTAAALTYTSQFSTYVDGTPVSDTMKNTAEVVNFLDDLFDSVNGSSTSIQKCQGKRLKVAVQDGSQHHDFWKEAIDKLEKLKFIDDQGRESYVPTLKNFISTIKSYMKVWQTLSNLGITVMRPRYFNTDPIENFFGQVRAYNYRNNDPTCHTFTNTFKSLTITRVIKFHSDSYNCEDDSAEQLLNIQSLFAEEENPILPTDVLPGHPSSQKNVTSIIEQARRERLNTHSRAYTAGWVVKKILQKISCSVCRNQLTTTADQSLHKWISQREFKNCKKQEKLNYPSEKTVRLFGSLLNSTNEYLENHAHEDNIKQKIYEHFVKENDIDLVECSEHRAFTNYYFTQIVIRFGIFNWCNVLNKILKGVDVIRLQNQILPSYQKLAYEKYCKKLKNKSLFK